MFLCSRYNEDSLCRPQERGDMEEAELGEALIDNVAYMVDERNHTTARCPFLTKAGKSEELQVTFYFTRPPHISYFSLAYTSGELTRFISEPLILATERNLALISVKQGPTWLPRSTDYTYLVYHAAATPWLSMLPLPKADLFLEEHCYLTQGEVGILVYQQLPLAPPTPQSYMNRLTSLQEAELCDAYKVAALYTRDVSGDKHYVLCIYDSYTDDWIHEPAVFSQEQPPPSFCSDRVLTVGGTMIWVDLSQGMILCQLQVLREEEEEEEKSSGVRQLRYIRFPKPLQPRDQLPVCVSTSSFSRDINIVHGRVCFVDLEIQASPSSLLPNCWTAITWSMSVNDSEYHKDREVKSADVASIAALDPQSFFVAHPTLSSYHGDILYLMAKPSLDPLDSESRVIAVDMRQRKIERVAKYITQRGASMDFAYMLTTISKYFAPPGDSNAILKKRGPPFMGSSSRKAPAFTLSRYDGDEVEEEDEDISKNWPSMNDNMDLE